MKKETIENALWGLLIGDAVGVPYEFHSAEELKDIDIEMDPPAGFDRSHRSAPKYAWSDDGAQMLALADALSQKQEFDGQAFAFKLHAWFTSGKYAAFEKVFDYGSTTAAALERLEQGTPWTECGGKEDYDNGNGSLMRVAPVAFVSDDKKQTIALAMQSSLPTHAHLVSQLCCALYCLTLQELEEALKTPGAKKDVFAAFEKAKESLIAHSEEYSSQWTSALNVITAKMPLNTDSLKGGFVVHTLGFALHAVQGSSSFKNAIVRAIRHGFDTDTVAAVAGPLAALYHGKVETTWLNQLADRASAADFIGKFSKKFAR